MRSCLFVPAKSAILPTHNGQYFHTLADHTCRTSSAAHRFFTKCQQVVTATRDTSGTSPFPTRHHSLPGDWPTSGRARASPRPQRGGDDARQTDAAAADDDARNDAVDE